MPDLPYAGYGEGSTTVVVSQWFPVATNNVRRFGFPFLHVSVAPGGGFAHMRID